MCVLTFYQDLTTDEKKRLNKTQRQLLKNVPWTEGRLMGGWTR